jgi:alpha,alpha-trehalose phosphorylase
MSRPVSEEPTFPVEPWRLREMRLDPESLARSESLFALSNGHIGVRGNLDEGEPSGLPGTYLNSFFDCHELNFPESGYAYPESAQSVVNVTNGKLIRLLVDDEPFDVRSGRLLRHERTLDFREGTLHREVEWLSPAGRRVRIRSTRLVSFSQRPILGIRYEVEPLERDARIVLQSDLVANETLPEPSENPGADEAKPHTLDREGLAIDGSRACLMHRTRQSGLQLAAAVDHLVQSDAEATTEMEEREDCARFFVRADLAAGQTLQLTKMVAYAWSPHRSAGALREQVEGALGTAVATGWDRLAEAQRRYLDEFWARADVELEGDPEVQQAVRFALFHLLQASAHAEERPIAAKGLTGTGYAGHAFWDTEGFVLPVLTATVPQAAADALRWRRSTLPLALDWARTLKLRGAAFPWRTINGEECGGYWPAGTAAFHVNADIALAAVRQVNWTGDEVFDRDCALPLLVETARLWHRLGHFGEDGRFHLDGVTGPDEYSALVDDNTFTNLMAQANLREAVRASRRWPAEAASLAVEEGELSAWAVAADAMAVPYDKARGMPEQDRGSTLRQRWDFEAAARDEAYPLYKHFPYFDLYRKQVVKQADLILAMHWCGDRFSPAEKAAGFAYYEELTVRDSSLSAGTQAVLAAEVGHLDLAHAYLREAALVDVQDRKRDTDDGLHMASLAGTWIGLVCGFGGLRDHCGRLRFAPRLPQRIQRLAFAVSWRGCCVRVQVAHDRVVYRVEGDVGDGVEIVHHGNVVKLTADEPRELTVPALVPPKERPSQPEGRAPEPVPENG